MGSSRHPEAAAASTDLNRGPMTEALGKLERTTPERMLSWPGSTGRSWSGTV
jgi:hypothetical protein